MQGNVRSGDGEFADLGIFFFFLDFSKPWHECANQTKNHLN